MSDCKILDNGFVILKEDKGIASPVGTLFFEYYRDSDALKQQLLPSSHAIQCVVSHDFLPNEVPPGTAQSPKLNDYADGIDTLEFLIHLG